jgi:hypothetical protein
MNRKIIHMPGTVLTPEVVLHRTLQKLEYIKSVVVIIEWDDETHDMDWSKQRLDTLAMARLTIEKEIFDLINRGKNDE